MGRYEGKLTVNKTIKDVPSAYASFFESARTLSEGPGKKSASQLFNEMVKSYYINEMGYSEEEWQLQVEAAIDLGKSIDGKTLNPHPDYYPYTP